MPELLTSREDASTADAAAANAELRYYAHAKHAIAAQVSACSDLLRACRNEDCARLCHELLVKLAEDRFTLAVVGQFKRGKSSLMNAIVGKEVLPTGILPLTSVVTILRFGPVERVVVSGEGRLGEDQVPLSELRSLVTQEGNPGNVRKLRAVYVELPSRFLRRGLEFVDTPGIGSAIEANTATTYDFVPQCDAVLFVTSVEAPFSEAEREFLRMVRLHVRKVFFVLNKIDLLAESERAAAIEFVDRQIRAIVGADADVQLFPVSSTQGLAAKQSNAGNGSSDARLAALEQGLGRFLATERSETFLAAVTDKAARLVSAQRRDLQLQQRLRTQSQDDSCKCESIFNSRMRLLRQAMDGRFRRLEQELRETTFDAGSLAKLDWHLSQLPVMVDNLVRQIKAGAWDSPRRLATLIANDARESLLGDLSNWFADRRYIAQQTLNRIIQREWAALGEHLAETQRQIDERLAIATTEHTLRAAWSADPPAVRIPHVMPKLPTWVPRLPWFVRFRPADMAQRPLRRRLARQARAYAEQCRSIAAEPLIAQLAASLEEFRSAAKTAIDAFEGANMAILRSAASDVQRADCAALLARAVEIERNLLGVRERLSPGNLTCSFDLPEPEAGIPAGTLRVERRSPQSVRDEFNTRSCPICAQVKRTLFDTFAQWQHQLASSTAAQTEFARWHGLCPLHAWQLFAISSPVGLSKAYAQLSAQLSAELSEAAARACTNVADLANLHRVVDDCRACLFVRQTEQSATRELAGTLAELGDRERYRSRSQGLCLRHLAQVMISASSDEIRRFLLRDAARRFDELAEDLASFTLKRAALERRLENIDERDAYVRVVTHIVGDRSLCVPWSLDSEI